jgi:serine O-acetyltransferase
MSIKELKYLISSDLHRYRGGVNFWLLAKELFLGIGFKYSFWMRLCRYFKSKSIFYFPMFIFSRIMLRRYTFKFGIQISYSTEIGPGFYIGHFGQIVVNGEAKIGRNCNISQGVTIGLSTRGEKAGVPVIGDNVYIGPGAKIIGGVNVGSGVAIGANAVVTKDVPDNAVVVGVPAKVISYNGSKGYINKTDYDKVE